MEEEQSLSADLLGNVLRPSSVRVSRSFRGSSRSSPRGSASPSFRRLSSSSVRTPRKDDDRRTTVSEWLYSFVRLFRRLPWLLLIVLWIVLVLKIYSRGPVPLDGTINNDGDLRQNVPLNKPVKKNPEDVRSGLSRLARDWIWTGYTNPKNRSAARRSTRAPGDAKLQVQPKFERKPYEYIENATEVNFQRFQAMRTGDYFLGRVVGPFAKLEQTVLGASSLQRQEDSSCSQKETRFAEFARGKRVVLLIHELSMTGSPLAMMELATEIQSCGGKVSVVVLDKRGGLLNELLRRKIPIVTDKAGRSWRAAAKAHLVVAGSAVCATWIDNYLKYNMRGASRIVWWIMENRREYYERSKRVLNKVGALVYLSRIQAEQWGEWSRSDNITFTSQPSIVSLSVNKDIASVAGISSSQANSTKALAELREATRASIGLQPNETLFASLSSINPGKGQLLALHAAASLTEEQQGSMKLLFGSVGSKSNKPEYVEKMLSFLRQNPSLEKSILWSPASVSVSAIYAAADVYLMNAQGMGETFGRVTIEAMSFGLPILGTDAGGTKELVEANSTGLLHPVGVKGAATLSKNMLVLMNNPTLGKEMGYKGREKVKSMYTKAFMYEKLAIVFSNCL